MKNFVSNVLIIIVTTIITLFLNTGFDLFLYKKGLISIAPPISKQTNNFLPMTITNFSSKTINGLRISVPKEITIQQIISSYALDIEDKGKPNVNLRSKKIILSGIEPNNMLTLLIPLTSLEDYEQVKALNSTELRMSCESFDNIEHPVKESFYSSIKIAAIYAIFFYLISYYSERKIEQLDKKVQETKKEIETGRAEMKTYKQKYDDEAKDVSKSLKRIQIVLLARIGDYSKELSFWRDTIRKILYENKKDKDVAETIIKKVTDNLKTYSTLNGYDQHSFDSVKVLADIVAYREKRNNK